MDEKKINSKSPIGMAINALRSGGAKSVAAMDLIKPNPGIAAVVSKMVPDRVGATFDNKGERSAELPATGFMKTLSNQTAQNISDSQAVMQMLPDTELAAQILISSIISPKDMVTTELTYAAPENLLPPDVASSMVNATRIYFEKNYNIKSILPQMLRDMLFETGSYPVAVLPESTIDDVINGERKISTESFKHVFDREGHLAGLGILGPADTGRPTEIKTNINYGMESLLSYTPYSSDDGKIKFTEFGLEGKAIPESFITVTDNFDALKIPLLNQRIREQRITELTRSNKLSRASSIAHEAYEKIELTDRGLSSVLFKNKHFQYTPITMLKTQEQLKRASVGEPLILKLPSESVIPVFVPGSPESHIGYFVLLDENGNPLSNVANIDYYNQLGTRLGNNSNSFASAMIQKVQANMNGFDVTNRVHLDYTTRLYGSMVERDLLARLRNGINGKNCEIANKQEVYRIMLSRNLAQQHTQMLYIPAELMTYFAFRYSKDGVGESLLDSMKILNSLRAMMLFTNVMASIKNSIGLTEVKLKLDEHDPDPEKAIERVMHEILRTRSQAFPVGTNNPNDIADYLGRAGLEFSFEGHPGLPDVSVEMGEKTHQFTKVDTDLEDSLRKRGIMGYGLSPDSVDAGFQAEFATSLTQNNLLLSKRVVMYQDLFHPLLQDHLRKVGLNSEELIDSLRDILTDNIDKIIRRRQKEIKEEQERIARRRGNIVPEDTTGQDVKEIVQDEVSISQEARDVIIHETLTQFINGFTVTLPQPSSITLKNQMESMNEYSEGLDKVIEAYVSSEFLNSDTIGDISSHVDAMKAIIKAYFMRRYMSENGIYTELGDLITADEEGRPIVDIYKEFSDHIQSMAKSLNFFMGDLKVTKDAANAAASERGDGSGGSSEPSSSEETPPDENDPYGMGGDLGGDDFGAGDPGEPPTEGDENPAVDGTTATTDEEETTTDGSTSAPADDESGE